MTIKAFLKKFGFTDKEIEVYLKILESGPSSVRKLASQVKINRGTTYDILKSLIKRKLVSYFYKDKVKHFIATDPANLEKILAKKRENLEELDRELKKIIPQLKSIYNDAGEKPKVKFYEGQKGIDIVLNDVLNSMSGLKEQREYFVYSSADIRKYLYKNFSHFNKERKKRKIKVKVLAIGAGGKLSGLDERKWITKDSHGAPTYTLIYNNKVAIISISSTKEPISIIIEDKGIFKTQVFLFKKLWEKF